MAQDTDSEKPVKYDIITEIMRRLRQEEKLYRITSSGSQINIRIDSPVEMYRNGVRKRLDLFLRCQKVYCASD